jgi:amidohydrolase
MLCVGYGGPTCPPMSDSGHYPAQVPVADQSAPQPLPSAAARRPGDDATTHPAARSLGPADGWQTPIEQWLVEHQAGLIALRRDLHAHPELARGEVRTTAKVAHVLRSAGLEPQVLPGGVGLVCDIGSGEPVIGLRADLDALPLNDEKPADVPYRSTVPGRCHACGHDVHTAVVVGAGLALAHLSRTRPLPGRVRLVFQPAEEAQPGGALDVIAAGGVDGVGRILCVHCDPRQDVGTVGLRTGPITGSSDHVRVSLGSAGGHTARPHLTGDLVYALAKIVTDVPSVLSRRVDPRAGLSVVWGRIVAGGAPNVIPQLGEVEGTVRSLDALVWEHAPEVVGEAVRAVAAPYGVDVAVEYTRGVPPVNNEAVSVGLLADASRAWFGDASVVEVEQSLGGEDFAWYLEKVPGALARLGVRTPGQPDGADLHQGGFDVDEDAIPVGVKVLAGAALLGLTQATS